MNKEKQIEEMAKAICHAPTCEIKKNGGTCYKYCKAYIYAFRAVNAGYRKASEVIDEFCERLKAEKFTHKNFGELVYVEDIEQVSTELKKKFTEDGK